MTSDKRIIRVALLLCDTPVGQLAFVADIRSRPCRPSLDQHVGLKAGELTIDLPIFKKVLLKSLESFPDRSLVENVELEVDGFDAVQQQYPSKEQLTAGGYDAIMLTGSCEL